MFLWSLNRKINRILIIQLTVCTLFKSKYILFFKRADSVVERLYFYKRILILAYFIILIYFKKRKEKECMEISQNPKSPLLICKCSLGMRVRIPHPPHATIKSVRSDLKSICTVVVSRFLLGCRKAQHMTSTTFHTFSTTFSRMTYRQYEVLTRIIIYYFN